MSDFKLNIEVGNAAMEEGEHVAGALRAVADKLESGETEGSIRDENGNTVGSFELDAPPPETDLSAFVRGYLEAALWSSTDENETPLDDNWTVDEVNAEDVKRIRDECAKFTKENAQSLYDFGYFTGRDAASLGHDLWLTRNHHGAGYWDRYTEASLDHRDDAENLGEKLTTAAQALGEQYAGPMADGITIHAG